MKKFLMLALILGSMALNAQVIQKCFLARLGIPEEMREKMVNPTLTWEKGELMKIRCTLIKVKATGKDYQTAQILLEKSNKLLKKREARYTQLKQLFGLAKLTGNVKQRDEVRDQILDVEDLIKGAKEILVISRNRLGYKYSPTCHFFPQGDKYDGIGYIACTRYGVTEAGPATATCVTAGVSRGALGNYKNPETGTNCHVYHRLMS